MKCQICNGLGFTESEHGLIQRKCMECDGTGNVPDVEVPDDAIDAGIEQVDTPARRTYTRKSTKPRKRPKGR